MKRKPKQTKKIQHKAGYKVRLRDGFHDVKAALLEWFAAHPELIRH